MDIESNVAWSSKDGGFCCLIESHSVFHAPRCDVHMNTELQKVLGDNLDMFIEVGEEFIRKGMSDLARMDEKKVHDLAVTLLVLYQGMQTLLASGVPEPDAREMWGTRSRVLFDGAMQRDRLER